MTTFLEDGDILLKINSRFLNFNAEFGSYIGEVDFESHEL